MRAVLVIPMLLATLSVAHAQVIVPELPRIDPAKVNIDKAQEAYDAANEAYSNGEYPKALRHVETAYGYNPNASTAVIRGFVLTALERPTEAFRAYLTALSLEPTADELKLISDGLKEQGKKAQPQLGWITLEVTPAKSRVVAGALAFDATRLKAIGAAVGKHTLQVEAEGHQKKEQTVTVKAGEATPLKVRLEKAPEPDNGGPEVPVDPVWGVGGPYSATFGVSLGAVFGAAGSLQGEYTLPGAFDSTKYDNEFWGSAGLAIGLSGEYMPLPYFGVSGVLRYQYSALDVAERPTTDYFTGTGKINMLYLDGGRSVYEGDLHQIGVGLGLRGGYPVIPGLWMGLELDVLFSYGTQGVSQEISDISATGGAFIPAAEPAFMALQLFVFARIDYRILEMFGVTFKIGAEINAVGGNDDYTFSMTRGALMLGGIFYL